MSEIVNLDQVGAQSKSAKVNADSSEDYYHQVQAHAGKMDGVRKDFKGVGGNSFTRAAVANVESGAEAGKRLAELAIAAVMAEKSILASDESAGTDQQAAINSTEATHALVSKSINA